MKGVGDTLAGKLDQLKAILAEVADLAGAAAVLEWDQEVTMPPGGVATRSNQVSTLRRLAHARFIADDVGALLSGLEDEAAGLPFDSDEASLLRVARRDFDLARKVPSELISEIAKASSIARPVWEKARREADYSLFAATMERNLELNRRLVDALGYEDRPYDALLGRDEPGFTTEGLEATFAELKKAIVPLISDIARNADAVDDRVLYRGFDPEVQVRYALDLVTKLGYDLEFGRQDLSTHPFSIAMGPGDSRITTRVSRDFFNECLFGSIHEAGHAMYNLGISDAIARTPLWDGASPGVHESQSRLWENLVGRSEGFWKHFFPSLRHAFPEQLRDIDAEAFFRAVNKSKPSLIRVEADEVTYNMHVLVRFELENEMLEGNLKVKDLPEAWNEKFRSYVGIEVPNAREGVLQDIHWSFVVFGGFAGYTIGNLIGAQLMEKVRTDISDLDAQIEAGQFVALLAWLRKNVHRHGRKFTPNELLERATGKPLTAAPWIAYIREKFGKLYSLEASRP